MRCHSWVGSSVAPLSPLRAHKTRPGFVDDFGARSSNDMVDRRIEEKLTAELWLTVTKKTVRNSVFLVFF